MDPVSGAALQRALQSQSQVNVNRNRIPLGEGAPTASPTGQSVEGAKFSDVLANALGEVNGVQKAADAKATAFIKGEDIAVHDLMASLTEAELSVQLTTAITTKAIQAYQELWRINV
ncbi:MAG: flagellar hook-basal body complex protein FliE [Myxococcota bacterium]|jgi:flagellar hook-basal body complex protein FliE